jgi:benzoyl-CoA reductase/2-hydroxyglutaryl-CoA dehydratase subunit BcrC/BadD/HgdB
VTQTPTDYRPMWSDLGLDLEKHDALLSVLGQAYQSLFLDRPNRPAGMGYFDFVMSEVHGLRIKELLDAKAAGRKVVGSFCVFVPEELILAVDGVSVGLCAGAEFGFEQAERYLPRSTCSLIKSFFGFTLERVCPYIAACDLVVGENTCDGKKKAYEPFAELVNDLYVIDLPQVKSAEGRSLLAAEYRKFARRLEEVSGKKITAESLHRGVEIVNAKRSAVHRLAALRNADPAPIAGLDALLVNQVYFYDDPVRFTNSVNTLCDELEGRVMTRQGVAPQETPRILISGCPMAVPNWKLPAIIEGSGAVIVGEESCVGERGTRELTGAAGKSVDEMLEAIVERYWKIDCAIFTPNPSRLEHVLQLASDHKADGVIHYSLQFCTPYQMESGSVERELEKRGVPVLRIDTDYSQEDVEQLRTRVEAFIERIRG